MEPTDKAMRRAMQILDATEAFAIHKEAFRLGWIAGRDAAASYVDVNVTDSGRVFAQSIRNMEPPA